MKSRLVRPKDEETEVETITLPVRNARTNEFAALSAYQHAHGAVRHDAVCTASRRRAISSRPVAAPGALPRRIYPGPGKDGKTVNAMVDYELPRRSDNQQPPARERCRAASAADQVRTRRRERSASRRNRSASPAIPRLELTNMRIADRASTGALELTFAHSTRRRAGGDPGRSVPRRRRPVAHGDVPGGSS